MAVAIVGALAALAGGLLQKVLDGRAAKLRATTEANAWRRSERLSALTRAVTTAMAVANAADDVDLADKPRTAEWARLDSSLSALFVEASTLTLLCSDEAGRTAQQSHSNARRMYSRLAGGHDPDPGTIEYGALDIRADDGSFRWSYEAFHYSILMLIDVGQQELSSD